MLRKMFLQLKIDILSGDNQGLELSVRKRIKKDLENSLKRSISSTKISEELELIIRDEKRKLSKSVSENLLGIILF